MKRFYLYCTFFASFSVGANNIEYCRIKYSEMLAQQNVIPTADHLVNKFYANYYHVFLKKGLEILSFEPNNKIRVSDEASRLGNAIFLGAECETVSAHNTDNTWSILKNYFEHQIKTAAYDVFPNGKSKNGHLVAKGALSSVGLNAKMDLTINSDTPYRK